MSRTPSTCEECKHVATRNHEAYCKLAHQYLFGGEREPPPWCQFVQEERMMQDAVEHERKNAK